MLRTTYTTLSHRQWAYYGPDAAEQHKRNPEAQTPTEQTIVDIETTDVPLIDRNMRQTG